MVSQMLDIPHLSRVLLTPKGKNTSNSQSDMRDDPSPALPLFKTAKICQRGREQPTIAQDNWLSHPTHRWLVGSDPNNHSPLGLGDPSAFIPYKYVYLLCGQKNDELKPPRPHLLCSHPSSFLQAVGADVSRATREESRLRSVRLNFSKCLETFSCRQEGERVGVELGTKQANFEQQILNRGLGRANRCLGAQSLPGLGEPRSGNKCLIMP